MPAPVLQFKRGNAGVAGTVPALRPGEPAISLNNFDFFIGIDTSVANNKFFGSHRYWGREDETNSLRLKLVDKDGINSINLKSPDTLAGIVTYTFPATPTADYYLKTAADGTLSWSAVSQNSFAGIVTFTDTTDNTLGNPNTGAVQIDGGLGVNKNVTVGAGLSVLGESYFIGTSTFYGGTLNLGDNDADNINVAGEFVSNLVPNATNTYDLGLTAKRWRNGFYSGNLEVTGNLTVDGLVTVGGGTTIILYGQDVYIKNKDIILGYTTSITNGDASTDDTANHAGVAIASTVGSPLVSFSASGINTLPDTYKQMMWFHAGTLGFGTDAFAFNYGVAIGTTTMADGVRLAVGSGITMSDNSISATNGYFTNISASTLIGSLTGTVSTATRATLIDTTAASDNNTYYVTFVDTSTGQTGETLRVGTAITLNASNGNVKTAGDVVAGSGYLSASDGTRSMYMYNATGDVSFQGKIISNSYRSSSNASDTLTFSDLDATFAKNLAITGITTIGTGVGITQFSNSVSIGTSVSSVPTSSAIITYVDEEIAAIDLTLGLNADSGGPSTVNTSQTLTISGTANEVETSVSGQTVTVGLPNSVIVGTSLSSPTVKVATLQHSSGANAATIDSSGNITASQNLTVSGDLYVNGSTTQINTTSLTVEDRTIQLGVVDGSAPSTPTTWDLGVLFNYYTDSAKQSAVVWEHADARFKFGSVISDSGGTGNNNPQITVSTFAPIEVSALWVTDCAGTSQVISCTGSTRYLENITVDAGIF